MSLTLTFGDTDEECKEDLYPGCIQTLPSNSERIVLIINTPKVSKLECTLVQLKEVFEKRGLSISSLKGLERARMEAFISPAAQLSYDSPITRSIGMTPLEVKTRKPLDLLPLSPHVLYLGQ